MALGSGYKNLLDVKDEDVKKTPKKTAIKKKNSSEDNKEVVISNDTTGKTINATLTLSKREKVMIEYGGLLNAIKEIGGDF